MAARLTIPRRIFLGFALVLSAFGVVAALSLAQHARTVRTLRLLDEGYLPLALTLGEAKATQAVFATLINQLEPAEVVSPQGWLQAVRAVRPTTLRRAYSGLDRANGLAAAAGADQSLGPVRESLDAVRQAYAASDADFEVLAEALRAGTSINELRLQQLAGRERLLQRRYRDGWRAVQEAIATTSAQAAEEERRSTILIGVLALIALLAGLLATWYSQRLLRPLPVLHSRVAAVARGDLSAGLEVRADDELGRLANAFERMVGALAARDESLRTMQRMQVEIVEGLRAAVVVVGRDDTVRSANPAALAVLGVSSDHTSLEESALIERVEGLGAALERVRGGDERAQLDEVSVEDGRSLDVLVTPFGDAEDGAALIVAEDVTDELETAARLIQTERLAAIGRMAAHVTHEVRNPLSSIGLNVEMLEEEIGPGGGEAAQLLGAVQREVDRLTDITEQYLRLARVPDPRIASTHLGEFLEGVVDFIRPEMRAHDVEVALEVPGSFPNAAFDPSQLRQAMLNLLRNAREAMPNGGRVDVRVTSDGDHARVRVRDHGAGIDAETRARIFDLFYTTKERGTGLGLPLTQQIVVAQGGRIECASPEEGEGTVFDVWLPFATRAMTEGVEETPDA